MLDSPRFRGATMTGSALPWRSRGTSMSTSPGSVGTVLARFPLGEFPAVQTGPVALALAQGSAISCSKAVPVTVLVSVLKNPPEPVNATRRRVPAAPAAGPPSVPQPTVVASDRSVVDSQPSVLRSR
jgi:hypothetical protein